MKPMREPQETYVKELLDLLKQGPVFIMRDIKEISSGESHDIICVTVRDEDPKKIRIVPLAKVLYPIDIDNYEPPSGSEVVPPKLDIYDQNDDPK